MSLNVRAVLNSNFWVCVDWALEATHTGLNGRNWNAQKHSLDFFLWKISLIHHVQELNWFSSILSEVLSLPLLTRSSKF